MPILGQEKKSTFSKGGITQNNVAGLTTSKLHNEYSITGAPTLMGKPSPSSLDLNGVTPTKYTDNLPG